MNSRHTDNQSRKQEVKEEIIQDILGMDEEYFKKHTKGKPMSLKDLY